MTDELKIMAEVVSAHGDPEAFGEREIVAVVDIQKLPYGTKLCRHDEAIAEIERLRQENETLRQQLSGTDENTLLRHISYIRQKSGVGMKPMLSELADAIAEKIKGERYKAMEEAATIVDAVSHEGLHESMWRNKFARVSAAIRALKENKNEN